MQQAAHNRPNVQRAATQTQLGTKNTANLQHPATQTHHPTSDNANVQNTAMHGQDAAIKNVQQLRAPHNVITPGGIPPGLPPQRHAEGMRQSVYPPPQGGHLQNATAVQPAAPPPTKEQQEEVYAQSQGFRSAEQFRKWQHSGRVDTPVGVVPSDAPKTQHRTTPAASGVYPSPKTPVTFTARHYDLPKATVPPNEKVTYQPGSHVPECQDWHDSKYDIFRNYTPTWQDKNWWITHHRRIVCVFGGWYYWSAGYWYPAWGYHPDSVYAYDGPIYAYNNFLPDEVVANVQAALQELGYYHGPINGILGSATREAIANYQRDHGLYATSAIDESTLAALGMA